MAIDRPVSATSSSVSEAQPGSGPTPQETGRNFNVAPNTGEVNPKDKPYYERQVPAFYSQIARAIDAKMPAKAPVPQILATIDNPQNQVKAAEVTWCGLKDWLVRPELICGR